MARAKKLYRSWGDISFDDDIILDVIESLNFTEKQITVFYNFLMLHIRELLREDKAVSLRLPHVGTFVFNTAHAQHYVDYLENHAKTNPLSGSQKGRLQRFKERIEIFEAFYEDVKAKDFVFSPHKTKSFVNSLSFRKGRSLEQLEIDQNSEKYAKKF
jgi:hypothetical protein